MNTTVTTVRSWPIVGLGAFFAGVTGYVLFKDVIDGAPINTSHVLTMAALVAAIASGHLAWPALRKRETFLQGLMLVIVALAATAYLTVSSGARNAETSGNKANAILAANTARENELRLKREAEVMLAEAQRNLARECKTGNGRNCQGIQKTIDVYEAAIRGHDAKLARLQPPKIANGYAHAAKILQSWGLKVSSDWLELNMDFVVVLITEFSTVGFLHLGLGHARQTRPAPVPANDPLPRPPVPPIPGDKAKVISWVREFRARNGRNPKIPELQKRFPAVPKTSAWRLAKAA